MAAISERLVETGHKWSLVPTKYHDAGHASVLALAETGSGGKVLLKAWPDPERCVREVAALRSWGGIPAARVLEVDEEQSIAALSLVGGRPGGCRRHHDDVSQVAEVIQAAHLQGRKFEEHQGFPELTDYLDEEVRSRVIHRMEHLKHSMPTAARQLLRTAWPALESLTQEKHRRTILHGDLYQENTACDGDGRPHLIDPLPLYGDAVYDWAFWSVYYRLGQGTEQRLTLASRLAGIEQRELRSWSLALCLHGLLYYWEVTDSRYPTMEKVALSLLATREDSR
ncbi:aminoglycoside phosphotransferase family protein [Nocardiopsis alba]|uniref:aminoglycoside phosphotransferase family protein n=1 Tax=Nocardiopsis alba TaxID=53437 RepID=UPI0033FF44D8